MRHNLSKRDQAACVAIGAKIREVRKAEGRTQVDVAKALGITQSHLSAIERGDATVGIRLVRIGRALKRDPKELLP
jgi:transcriptional regulator with XRE-family HTH domain